ncbi:MAG: helix-turn-helix domain-containing protein [Candidatus Auribacterota bacterium]|jgi:transcriptional regulator with XRE-family HTH domain|nr:helix-turn-helix domain-containing protein [Candidatus Auribacterota bacterium]
MTQYFDFKALSKLRKKKHLTMEKLAHKAGISYSAIADIERNKVTPNLETLFKIASVLSCRTSDLISLAEGKHAEVLRETETVRLNGFNMRIFSMPDMRVMFGHAEDNLPSDGKSSSHPNINETLFVIDGKCRVNVDGEDYDLTAGEMIRFAGFLPHYLESLTAGTKILVINSNK